MVNGRPYNGEHAQYFEESLKYMCFVDANASKEEQAKAIIDFNEEHFFGQSYIAYCENKGDGKPHVNAVHQVLDMRDPSKRPLPVYGVQIDVDFMDRAHSKMRGGLRGLTLDKYLDMVHDPEYVLENDFGKDFTEFLSWRVEGAKSKYEAAEQKVSEAKVYAENAKTIYDDVVQFKNRVASVSATKETIPALVDEPESNNDIEYEKE